MGLSTAPGRHITTTQLTAFSPQSFALSPGATSTYVLTHVSKTLDCIAGLLAACIRMSCLCEHALHLAEPLCPVRHANTLLILLQLPLARPASGDGHRARSAFC